MSERTYIAKNFRLDEILDFMEDHDVEVMKGPREGTFICLIDYEGGSQPPYATETNFLTALINGIRNYENDCRS
jgi:hypothetical protein